jgi:tRNA(Ile)-lysidine synthetase-like protein
MRYRAADLARPLLAVDRAEIESYIVSLGLAARRDPTNDDPRFARNRLRQVVLPGIDAFSPSARRRLAQTADILAEEDRLLEAQLDSLPPGIVAADAFRALPVAIQRRLLRRQHPDINFLQVETGRLSPSLGGFSGEGPAELQVSECDCDPGEFRARDRVGHLDADRVRMPLTVGHRRPGDRMRPLGMVAPKRLQNLLVDAAVPNHLRDSLPIVSDREEIVWIPGVSVAERKRVTGKTRRQLHLEMNSL